MARTSLTIMSRLFVFILFVMLVLNANASDYVFSESGVKFSWKYDDTVVLFTDQGNRMLFWAFDENGNNTKFTADGWGVAGNSFFTLFYPYTNRSGSTPETALPMTYDGQKQTANGNTSHLSAYDYMKTPRTRSTDTELNFAFSHLGSVIRFEIAMPSTQQLTSLTLNTETPITLALDGIKVPKGENLVAYMMVPPMTLTNEGLKVTLTNSFGQVAEMTVCGSEILAGKCYPVTLACAEFETVAKSKGNVANTEMLSTETTDHKPVTTAAGDPILYPTAYAPDFLIDAEHPLRDKASKILGDVNNDGEVMLDDAVLLVNHVLRRTTYLLDKEVADANKDGDVDIADAVAIVNIYLKR